MLDLRVPLAVAAQTFVKDERLELTDELFEVLGVDNGSFGFSGASYAHEEGGDNGADGALHKE